MRGWQLLVPLTAGALLPAHGTAAQQSCTYTLQLTRAVVASTFPPPPPGYEYAKQPSAAKAPGDGAPLAGALQADQDCRESGIAVGLEARPAGNPTFVAVRRATTDAQGNFRFEPRPTRTAVVRAVATTPDGRTVTSPSVTLSVRVAVSATYTREADCGLVASGSTFPAKPNHPVHVQVAVGSGYSTVGRAYAGADGQYQVRWHAGCGPHNLVVTVPQSGSNTSGRTLYARQGVLAK